MKYKKSLIICFKVHVFEKFTNSAIFNITMRSKNSNVYIYAPLFIQIQIFKS